MTNRHIDFYDSHTMRELARISKAKGLVKDAPLVRQAADHSVESTGDLLIDLSQLVASLEGRGMIVEAKALSIKVQNFYSSMVDEAHPEGSKETAVAQNHEGTVETKEDQQRRGIENIEKEPSGKFKEAKDRFSNLLKSAQLAPSESPEANQFGSVMEETDPTMAAKKEAADRLQPQLNQFLSTATSTVGNIQKYLSSFKFTKAMTTNEQFANLYSEYSGVTPGQIAKFWGLCSAYNVAGGVNSLAQQLQSMGPGAEAFVRASFPDIASKYWAVKTAQHHYNLMNLLPGQGEDFFDWKTQPLANTLETVVKLPFEPMNVGNYIGKSIGDEAGKEIKYNQKKLDQENKAEEREEKEKNNPTSLVPGTSFSSIASDIISTLNGFDREIFGDKLQAANDKLASEFGPVVSMANSTQQLLGQLDNAAQDLPHLFSKFIYALHTLYTYLDNLIKAINPIEKKGFTKNSVDMLSAAKNQTNQIIQVMLSEGKAWNVDHRVIEMARYFGQAAHKFAPFKDDKNGAQYFNQLQQAANILWEGRYSEIKTLLKNVQAIGGIFSSVKSIEDMGAVRDTVEAYLNSPAVKTILQSKAQLKSHLEKKAQLPSMSAPGQSSKGPTVPASTTVPAGGSKSTVAPGDRNESVQEMQFNLQILARTIEGKEDQKTVSDLLSVGRGASISNMDGVWGSHTAQALAAAKRLLAKNKMNDPLDLGPHLHDGKDTDAANANIATLRNLISKLGGEPVGGKVKDLSANLMTFDSSYGPCAVSRKDIQSLSNFYDFLKRISGGSSEILNTIEGEVGISLKDLKSNIFRLYVKASNAATDSTIDSKYREIIVEVRIQCVKLMNLLRRFGGNDEASLNRILTKDMVKSVDNDAIAIEQSKDKKDKKNKKNPYQWADYQTEVPLGGGAGHPGQQPASGFPSNHEGYDYETNEKILPPPFDRVIDLNNQFFDGVQSKYGLTSSLLDYSRMGNKRDVQSWLLNRSVTDNQLTFETLRTMGLQPINDNSGKIKVKYQGQIVSPDRLPMFQQTRFAVQNYLNTQALQNFLIQFPQDLKKAVSQWEQSGPPLQVRQAQQTWLNRWMSRINDLATERE